MAGKEYIEREAAYPLAKKICDAIDSEDFQRLNFGMRILDWIDDLPAANVRPVARGKWKLGGYGQISDATVKWYDRFMQGGFLYCSACKERSSVKTHFCPNCGADMREES